MSRPDTYIVRDERIRERALSAVRSLDSAKQWEVRIKEYDRRSLDQNAKFHAICRDVSRQAKYMNRALSPEQWKVLFISGHAIATGMAADVIPGIEGEFVNIRESSARMTKGRMASVIEYTLSWCADAGVKIGHGEIYA